MNYKFEISFHLVTPEPTEPTNPLAKYFGKQIRFASDNYPDRFIRHRGFAAWFDKAQNTPLYIKDSTFILVKGLAGKGVSFKSVNYPDRFLRHRGFNIFLDKVSNAQLFKLDYLEHMAIDLWV